MAAHFFFYSSAFKPRPGELDDTHQDYINPDVFALDLADFLVSSLESKGYTVKFRCQEDWGHWVEFDHPGDSKLALGCSNLSGDNDSDDATEEHHVLTFPDKPYVRKWFRKIDVREDVEALSAAVHETLNSDARITKLRVEHD